MSTGSILSILTYPQYGYHLVYHTGLSLVHCSYLSVGSLHAMLSKRLYLSSPGKYFQIVGYWVLQACGHSETYTIRDASARGIQHILSGHCPTAGLKGIHTFVLLFSRQVLSNC